MARDDWRVRIELGEEPHARHLLDLFSFGFGSKARELAQELKGHRLAVSSDDNEIFVYTSTRREAEQALKVIEAEPRERGLEPRSIRIEHWLADEERWDDEPSEPDFEEELLARGYAPWEVRVECRSHREAEELADQLERESYSVVRGFRYVIVGTATREEAEELARRLHGEVEPGGALVWEVAPHNPFAVFGGLGGTGTPL